MIKKLWLYIILLIGLVAYILLCASSSPMPILKEEILINGARNLVFVTLNDVKEWPKWTSWKKEDMSLAFTPGKKETNVGAYIRFEGNSFGKGFLELQESFKDSSIFVKIYNDDLPAPLHLNFGILGDKTNRTLVKVQGRLAESIPFLLRPFHMGLSKKLNDRLKNDLNSLKNYLETMINSNFGINSSQFDERYYIGIKEAVNNATIPAFYAKSLPKVYKLIDSMGLEMVGPPCGLIYDWNGIDNMVYIMAAIPVKKWVLVPPEFVMQIVKKAPCYKLAYYGPYNGLKSAHIKLNHLMNNGNFELVVPIIEEYVTNPSQEPDTSKWLTNIYYLLNTGGGFGETVKDLKTQEDQVREEEEFRKKKLNDLNKLR
ncbi:MAG: hypothetical protein M3Q56_10315 [Bacteroidota bacterium]|nr:hypothetical protein [Bacteroidota bacterium]